jgi:hypothetical protein
VVGRDRIQKQAKDAAVDDVLDRLAAFRHVVEVRRVLHIGGAIVPLVGQSALDRDLAPQRVAFEHVRIFAREHLLADALAHDRRDLAAGGPDVAQIDLAAVLIGAERRLGDIDLHRAGKRISDDQRRRGKVIGPYVGIHAALEIAIAGEYRRGDQIVLVDGFRNLFGQRA